MLETTAEMIQIALADGVTPLQYWRPRQWPLGIPAMAPRRRPSMGERALTKSDVCSVRTTGMSNARESGSQSPVPLVVDLDGTLIQSDLLLESASTFALTQPLRAYKLLAWAFRGRAFLKHALAIHAAPDPAVLPYRAEVIQFLQSEHRDGRTLVLASASHETLVAAVADEVGLFAEYMGSTKDVNLRSTAKRDALVARSQLPNSAHGLSYRGRATPHTISATGPGS